MFKIVCLYVPLTSRLLASLSCYYDVNPVVALSEPNDVVPFNDRAQVDASVDNQKAMR